MNTIKVDIDPIQSRISIYNNGQGIPIEIHAKERVYIPELIFGHLLTSSNYNDEERKESLFRLFIGHGWKERLWRKACQHIFHRIHR